MQNVQIVTDSCAHFANAHLASQYGITVVPNKITIGSRTYREGVDLSPEEAFKLMAHETRAPVIEPPSAADYLDVFTRLARTADAIISIHVSREILPSFQRGKQAAQQLAGYNKIMLIDSQSLTAGQAMLVRAAAKAVEQNDTLDEIVRVIRGAIERIYAVFYTESMNYIVQNKIIPPSQTILGAMLGIKPFLTIEEGRLKPMEKVRTRIQAVERLVEFAVEFTDIEDAVILQHKPYMSEQTRMLQDRLAVEFPGRHFPYMLYGPSLAALIGTDASGLVVLESETVPVDDDF